MATISVNVSEELLKQLQSESARREATLDDLISLGIRRVLVDHNLEVRRLADEIIEEDKELLRRLA